MIYVGTALDVLVGEEEVECIGNENEPEAGNETAPELIEIYPADRVPSKSRIS